MDSKFYKRAWNGQYWKFREDGKVLLINCKMPNKHTEGDCHLHMKGDFDMSNAEEISEAEFNKVRKAYAKKLMNF